MKNRSNQGSKIVSDSTLSIQDCLLYNEYTLKEILEYTNGILDYWKYVTRIRDFAIHLDWYQNSSLKSSFSVVKEIGTTSRFELISLNKSAYKYNRKNTENLLFPDFFTSERAVYYFQRGAGCNLWQELPVVCYA